MKEVKVLINSIYPCELEATIYALDGTEMMTVHVNLIAQEVNGSYSNTISTVSRLEEEALPYYVQAEIVWKALSFLEDTVDMIEDAEANDGDVSSIPMERHIAIESL